MTIALKPTPARQIPGPRGIPVLGNLPQMRHKDHPFDQWLSLHEEYGDIVRLRVGPREILLIRDPDMAQHILQLNNKNYWKGERMGIIKALVGEGLLTSEGDFWRRQRRLMQPAFHRGQIANLAQVMIDTAAETLPKWEPLSGTGKVLDISDAMMRLTLDIVSKTLFSTALTPEEINTVAVTLAPLLTEINTRTQKALNWTDHLPLPRNLRFNRGIKVLDEIIYRIIAERRTSGEQKDDLLGMLLQARDADTHEQMTDEQIRDEAMTIFLAGHETTAVALSWTTALLSKHPDIRKKLQNEVDEVLDGRLPTPADFPDLAYTRMVIEENMRLYPPAGAVGRSPIEDDELGGFHVPAGVMIIVNIYGIHRHPRYWDNPEGFNPERFSPENAKKQHRFAYIPFSTGPRVCIGNHFAMMEATLLLAMMAQKYELNLVPGADLTPRMTLTTRPKYGVPVTVEKRA